jgi:hypothetical protein
MVVLTKVVIKASNHRRTITVHLTNNNTNNSKRNNGLNQLSSAKNFKKNETSVTESLLANK